MDSYEYKLRYDEINELIKRKDFKKAVEIADTINWTKVRSTMTLCNISDLYKKNRKYDEAKFLLEQALKKGSQDDKNPINKLIISSLCDLCIRMGDIVGATEYYKRFVQIAPTNNTSLILLYKIYEAQDVSLEERVQVLEELKKREPITNIAKWVYELASLYHQLGLTTKCVDECDEIILWLREGKYVKKAMELKMLHQQLTQSQEALYRSIANIDTGSINVDVPVQPAQTEEPVQEQTTEPAPEEVSAATDVAESISEEAIPAAENTDSPDLVKTVDVGQYSTINIQRALEESIKGSLNEPEEEPDDNTTYMPSMEDLGEALGTPEQAEIASNGGMQEIIQEAEPEESAAEEPVVEDIVSKEPADEVIAEKAAHAPVAEEPEAAEIIQEEVKQDTGKIEEIIIPDVPVAKTGDTQVYERRSKKKNKNRNNETVQAEPVKEDIKTEEPTPVAVEKTEDPAPVAEEKIAEPVANVSEDPLQGIDTASVSKEELMKLIDQKVAAALERAMAQHQMTTREVVYVTSESEKRTLANTNPPKAIQGMLSEADDGQIQMVVPEEKQIIEKQITGQIEIKDYLNDWESSKKRRQRSQEERIDKLVSQHTDNLLEAFENATREDGLLEKIKEEQALTASITKEEKKAPEPVVEEQEKEETSKDVAPVEAEETEQETAQEVVNETEAVKSEAEITEETAPVEEEKEVVEAEEAEVTEEERERAEHEAEEIAAAEAEAIDDDDEDDGSVRAMTDEESALFSQYVQTKTGKKNLLKALDTISLASYVGNVCVTGETGEESVELAKNVVQYAKNTDANFSGKIGKVSGASLNDKDVEMLVNKLSNGGLIIEKAGEMTEDTAYKLYKALDQENLGLLVVLQDSRKAINKIIGYNDALKQMFNVRIEIEELSDDALVAYGRKYAERKEFAIDDMGILALHTRIDEMQTSDHIVTVTDVRDIVDKAIDHATRFNPSHFTDILFGKRYNEDDMIVLKEKDFAI